MQLNLSFWFRNSQIPLFTNRNKKQYHNLFRIHLKSIRLKFIPKVVIDNLNKEEIDRRIFQISFMKMPLIIQRASKINTGIIKFSINNFFSQTVDSRTLPVIKRINTKLQHL